MGALNWEVPSPRDDRDKSHLFKINFLIYDIPFVLMVSSLQTRIFKYACVCVCMHTHTCMCIDIYVLVYIYTHINIVMNE